MSTHLTNKGSSNLHVAKRTPVLPIDTAVKAAESHRPEDSGYWAPLGNINKFLKALKGAYGVLTIDQGVQTPKIEQVWAVDPENLTRHMLNALGDMSSFGGDKIPITLTNKTDNQLWKYAEYALKNPQKFGAPADMPAAKKLVPWGKVAVLQAPTK